MAASDIYWDGAEEPRALSCQETEVKVSVGCASRHRWDIWEEMGNMWASENRAGSEK